MLEQTLTEDEPPRPRLRGPLAPVRVVLGAGKGVGQGIGSALQRIARRGKGVLASVASGQLYGGTEEVTVAEECAPLPCHPVAPGRSCPGRSWLTFLSSLSGPALMYSVWYKQSEQWTRCALGAITIFFVSMGVSAQLCSPGDSSKLLSTLLSALH